MALSRKQREIQERHGLILDAARELLAERGYLGLTMDRVAGATEYSKGTIYQHFPNKEEILGELAIQTGDIRCALFQRAATFRGSSRERMTAVGAAAQLFMRLHPVHAQTEHVVKAASVRDKISPARQERLHACETRCMSVVSGIVRDGIAADDLTLPAGSSPEDVTFGLWALHVGTQGLVQAGVPLGSLGVHDPLHSLTCCAHLILDGLGWRPLLADHDYDAVRARVQETVFPTEFAQLEEALA